MTDMASSSLLVLANTAPITAQPAVNNAQRSAGWRLLPGVCERPYGGVVVVRGSFAVTGLSLINRRAFDGISYLPQ